MPQQSQEGRPGPQRISAVNQVETTFLFSSAPSLTPTGFFAPSTAAGIEVFGAGHNALGAWWWLAASGSIRLQEPAGRFHQQLGRQVLPLTIHAASGRPVAIAMTQAAPTFGAVASDRRALADALGLREEDLLVGSLRAEVVATDVAHLMVPVRRDALPRARPHPERLAALVSGLGGEGCYLFTIEPRDATATVDARFFNPGVGIGEDPATGTAAGPLAAYLVHYGVTAGPRIIVDQGLYTGRPSRIEIHVNGSHIELRGATVVTAEGTVRIR